MKLICVALRKSCGNANIVSDNNFVAAMRSSSFGDVNAKPRFSTYSERSSCLSIISANLYSK